MRQGPLAGRYPAVAAMVTLALIPYLALSAAIDPLVPIISEDLHTDAAAMSLASGLGNAAYAVGTVLAVQFAQLFPQRRMLLGYGVLLVVGSVLVASAPNVVVYASGHVLQGLCTSMMLIAAAPPLTIGFPRENLRNTAVIMNMCVFGAVALGPFLGGVQSAAHAWRPLFWIVAGVATAALVMVALTFEDAPPADRSAPRDLLAIGLATAGCTLAFVGASRLIDHGFADPSVSVPMGLGMVLIVVLIVYQATAQRPLLTIRSMLTSSIPVAGVGVALFAAAASVAATALTAGVLLERFDPVRVGLLYLPELGGAIVMAFVFGRVITRKAMHYLPLVGMGLLAVGVLVFRLAIPDHQGLILVASTLTGLALGASVAPALFVAGFSLESAKLQRVFAIIELLRAVAAFLVAPVLAHFAATASAGPLAGTGQALWIGVGLALAGAVFGVAVYGLSGARPQRPDLDAFLDGESPAWYSPPLLSRALGRPVEVPVAPLPVPAEPTAAEVAAELAGAGVDGADDDEFAAAGRDSVLVAAGHRPSTQIDARTAGTATTGLGALGATGFGAATGSSAGRNGSGHATPAPNGAAPGAAADAPAGTGGDAGGLVLFAYDGSEHAKCAIGKAAAQLPGRRDAVVVCVWQPVDVGFTPVDGNDFDADQATEVRAAAESTAAAGAELASRAGFRARGIAVEAAPVWEGIVSAAGDCDATLIVVGPHRRSGLLGHLRGSVTAAVVAHSETPVLVIPECAEAG